MPFHKYVFSTVEAKARGSTRGSRMGRARAALARMVALPLDLEFDNVTDQEVNVVPAGPEIPPTAWTNSSGRGIHTGIVNGINSYFLNRTFSLTMFLQQQG